MNYPIHTWSLLFPADIVALAAWVRDHADGEWSSPPAPTKPQRVYRERLPIALVQPIFDRALAELEYFPGEIIADMPMLSRMMPGQSHGMHADIQSSDWITRVHVPIVTNPEAWIMFESEGQRVHFAEGMAYTFNTIERHAFGNDGPAPRVHLIFDVLRKDT